MCACHDLPQHDICLCRTLHMWAPPVSPNALPIDTQSFAQPIALRRRIEGVIERVFLNGEFNPHQYCRSMFSRHVAPIMTTPYRLGALAHGPVNPSVWGRTTDESGGSTIREPRNAKSYACACSNRPRFNFRWYREHQSQTRELGSSNPLPLPLSLSPPCKTSKSTFCKPGGKTRASCASENHKAHRSRKPQGVARKRGAAKAQPAPRPILRRCACSRSLCTRRPAAVTPTQLCAMGHFECRVHSPNRSAPAPPPRAP